MWPFKKKYSLADSSVFQGFTDWHNHILPGVDDGVQTMDEALEILALYERLGVKEIWLTPHIMEDIPNTTAHLKERFKELRAAYKGNIELNLSAEYMLDNLFRQRLDDNDLLPFGERGDRLLVETSYHNPPENFYVLLEEIKAKGFHPVLAHPERYTYMEKDAYRNLKDMGIRFQLNLFSLTSLYGKEAQKNADYLAQKGLYDLSGTDIHGIKMFQTCLTGKIKYKIPGTRFLQCL
ncbi:tyrosine-protein phosphatase [Bacteroides sp. AN502(2024)]|uniref:tyrosine-protein phosphatase n=1 Tax=Bacteroides sp. AN502(2024) TaxID=3160599 RepID=UPI0035194FBB